MCDHAHMIIDDERDDNIYDQGSKFEGDLVEPHPGHRLMNISCKCIINCVIGPFIFKLI
jgi:hypothetical protein